MRTSRPDGHGNGQTAERSVSLAYSPCPNDTFMFFHLANKSLAPDGAHFDVHLHDVETLNRKAVEGVFDVSKVSFHAYLRIKDSYRLLRSGAAMGFGCGPLVVSREPRAPAALRDCTIAIPGELTTGHLLMRLWMPTARAIKFVSYDRILPMLKEGAVDAGVIIHESRFVYEQAGMHRIQDLGQWWEQETGLPVPLGGIVAHKRLGDRLTGAIEAAIRQSIEMAQQAPDVTMPYVRRFALEMQDDVLQRHIRTFVNEFSVDFGDTGRRAIERLEAMARRAGVIG